MRSTTRARVGEIARAIERRAPGDSFSPEKGWSCADAVFVDQQDARLARGDGAPAGAIGAGQLAARSAIAAADWPITAGESLPSGHISAASVAFCARVEQDGAARGQRGQQRARAPRRRRPGCSPTSSSSRCRRSSSGRCARPPPRRRRSRRRCRRRCRRRRRTPACRSRRRRARWPASRSRRRGRTGASARAVDVLGDRRRQQLDQVARELGRCRSARAARG